jgi:glycogen debranching enzyme
MTPLPHVPISRVPTAQAMMNDSLPVAIGHHGDEPPELPAGSIAVLQGSTFVLSDAMGDVHEDSVEGLFHADTRLLSRLELDIDGQRPHALSSGQTDFKSARFFLVNAQQSGLAAESVSIERDRFVSSRGMHEDLVLRSHHNERLHLHVRLRIACDFADLFEVKGQVAHALGSGSSHHDAEGRRLRFEHRNDSFVAGATIVFSQSPTLEGDDVWFDVDIPARGVWRTCVDVSAIGSPVLAHHADGRRDPVDELTRESEAWKREFPVLAGGSDLVRHVYERSVDDLAGLRMELEHGGARATVPAAGMPWFMTLFGRDSLITSFMTLPLDPTLAHGSLRLLAALQGERRDDFRDEEAGKIMHEIRFGELAMLGHIPHRPYYGSVDATPLWLILLSEYWRVTRDDATARQLWPNAVRAWQWIEDQIGDEERPYLSYATRSRAGLRNQGWKDSEHGVVFANGASASPPIAICEAQGYAYDAACRLAELADEVMGDAPFSERLRSHAGDLAARFNQDFWLPGRGYYALGLDADGRPIDALTSNIGHLLWSGIVPADRATLVAGSLFSDDLWSGWGVRTMSRSALGYTPVGYHLGTVWPHDNAIVAAGLARYGFREQALRIGVAMLEAASLQGYRLPEAIAGYERSESVFPVRYPTASSPQAWATAAPFLWLRIALGLDYKGGRPICEPHVPIELGAIDLRGVHGGDSRWNVRAEGQTATVERASPNGRNA